MKKALLLAGVLFASGCVSYSYTRTGMVQSAPRGANCDFAVLTVAPDRQFDELGVLDAGGGAAIDIRGFSEAVGPSVCAAGGDAVLAVKNGRGSYMSGTVIKFRDSQPEAPAPQAADQQ